MLVNSTCTESSPHNTLDHEYQLMTYDFYIF